MKATKAKKKLFTQDTQDLVNLSSVRIEKAFMRAVRNRLDISTVRPMANQPTVFVVYFDIVGGSGGVTSHLAVDHREIVTTLNDSDRSKFYELLDSRATTAAHDMVSNILETGAKQLAWNRVSRWQRLKWAWRGIIQPHA